MGNPDPRHWKFSFLFSAILCATTLLSGCTFGDDPQNSDEAEGPLPVIFIPGITGSELVAKNDGHILWPPEGPGANRALNVLAVRSDFVRLSLIPLANGIHEEIYATDAIRADGETRIYGPLIDHIIRNGNYVEYRVEGKPERRTYEGCDMSQREAKPSFFVFAYDWRLAIEDNSELLADYVRCIKKLYPERKDLKVNIVTHSMGGLVARRYIIDYPERVDKLITIAAPFLGSPKPLFQMIYGKISVDWGDLPGEELFGTYGLLGSPLSEMLAYYPGLHQLMSSSAYYDLGGRAYSQITTSSLDQDLEFTPFMGQGGVVDNLFPQFFSYNGKTPAQSNRDFHSYCKNKNCQDDWSTDTSGVKYFHLIGVQHADNTPLTIKDRSLITESIRPIVTQGVRLTLDATVGRLLSAYASSTISQTVLRQYSISKYGKGDGTVPRLSAERIGNGKNLNAPNAKLFVYLEGDDSLLDHADIVKNPDVQAKVSEILKDVAQVFKDPIAACEARDYKATFQLYKDGVDIGNTKRSDGDARIMTATCAFGFHDYATSKSQALQGASASSKGGKAHNLFIAEYAAERLNESPDTYRQQGLAAAKQSGQCGGNGTDACAEVYRTNIRRILETREQQLQQRRSSISR